MPRRCQLALLAASTLVVTRLFAQIPATGAEAATAATLQRVRGNTAELTTLLHAMPKGGDLHNHLSGAIYAETLIRLAAEEHLCTDASGQLSPPPCDAAHAAVNVSDETQRRLLTDAWSMRDFVPHAGESGHDHFFDTFDRFDTALEGHLGDELADAMNQAAADHVSYLELMQTPGEGAIAAVAKTVPWPTGTPDLAALRQQLDTPALAGATQGAAQTLTEGMRQAHALMHCNTPAAQPGCGVAVRFLYQVLRGLDPSTVFAQMIVAYRLASGDPQVVGLNMVMPEDGHVALSDFELQMRMLDLLHAAQPAVKVTLHAGELAPGLVPDAELRFHIRDSIEIGHALRIGHGVDVMHEDRPLDLLREMAARHVLVEVCLSSNDEILGITGMAHPLPEYLRFGVPVALATDDEGVSRGDLTKEYVRAEQSYALPYATLKQMVRASLEHAFVDGTDLWRAPDDFHVAPACAATTPGEAHPDADCAALLRASPKARLEWQLEAQLRAFERWVATQPF